MITLRPYQQEDLATLLAALEDGKNPVCALPTGSGKSVIISALCQSLPDRILVVTHRKELIAQNEATLVRLGSGDTGVYSAGIGRREADARVVFAGVQSIYKRMDELQASGPFRYVIWDEAHANIASVGAPGMANDVLHACWHAQRIGMSATPYRMDEGPIWGPNGWFDCLAVQRTITELVETGYLSRLIGVKTASAPDLSSVRNRAGDYVLSDLSQASSVESVVASACEELCYLARDRRSILVFCVDRAHALTVADTLRTMGESPEIVLGNTPSQERDEILSRFKSGAIRMVVNVGVLTTGVDVPSVDCVAIIRATQSKSLFVQMMGRGSRLSPSKTTALILDMGGNLERHLPIDGIPEAMRSPRLAEEEEKKQVRERVAREERVRHQGVAARDIDPLSIDTPAPDFVNLRVKECTYLLRAAKKYPDRQNLIVSYKCEGRTVTQFVLLEYPGRPGIEAVAWFDRRGMVKPLAPRDALRAAWRAPIPHEIVVGKSGQWDVVAMEHFGD